MLSDPWPIFRYNIIPKELDVLGQKIVELHVVSISIDFSMHHIHSMLSNSMPATSYLKPFWCFLQHASWNHHMSSAEFPSARKGPSVIFCFRLSSDDFVYLNKTT